MIKRAIYYVVPILSLLLGFGMYQLVTNSLQVDARTLAGDEITWSELNGQKTVINFFAEWCAPCLREIPELNAFYKSIPTDTRMFMVSYDQLPIEKLAQLKTKYSIHAPIIVNEEGMRLPMPIPDALPATFILSGSGEITSSLYGEITNVELQKQLVN